MEKIQKTNAARLLDKAGIPYGLVPYTVDPDNREVDLKKAAKAAGAKKADLIPMKELLPLTGYIRGGCSPVGMKKSFPTFFHLTAGDYEEIYVSAGVRGLQFKIKPEDIIRYTRAKVADIVTEES